MEESEKADSETIPTNDDASPSQGKSCALCGCATPAVRCDRCNSQIFCLSCDDMYHRHPKRKLHLRKAVDSIWTTARSPRLRRRTELPGDPCKIPIPPPRSKKREHRTIGSRTFLKSGLELGSFGHSKVFSPASKDFFAGQKSPASMVESNCDDGTPSPNIRSESGQIYENDNITNATGNLDDRSPWNPRPNISSPIQVSIPSSSPDIVANGQSFGYPAKPHSQSAADLTAHAGHPVGHHPYHFHPPYPYMHPPMHPYSHSMAHLNCAQCISSSWSNLISPHPSPYFHPMPWGSAQNTLSRPPIPGQPSQPMKHSHGDLPTYPDSGLPYPYPGAPYYHNGPPVVDPNFIKDLHEQAEMQKQRKEVKSSPRIEDMDIAPDPSPIAMESSSSPIAAASTEPVASTAQDAQATDEAPAAPEKPTEPWSCVHCTFINPPGEYICQVCCKTSYGNKSSGAAEEQIEDRPESRDTDSPLINRDALMNSPGVSEIRDAQKDADIAFAAEASDFESIEHKASTEIFNAPLKLTTETQTFTTTKTTDVQTQNITRKSMASSTDSIFPKQEISVQTEIEALTKHCSVATDPMISSQSLESLLSGVSAPPYHNRRAGWGRGATSFSTQSLYERGRSRSPMPRSLSFHTEAPPFGQDSSFASEEAMHSASQAWLYADPMYYKPHNRVLGQSPAKEDYFDGTWGSMDRLNHRVKHKKDKEKLDVRPKFHRSLDDLKSEKKPEFIHTHELMMLQTVKEAERCGFTLEDLHVSYLHCGKENPVFWLEDNWPQMIKNVIGLAAKYGEENEENDVGAITTTEAKEALRIHRGDIWDAVAECIETRQRKILELTVRGNFTQKQIAETLKNNEGNVELAYADLLRASTRRHKFILSPGLSTDSEDLNVYNPAEDSTADHNISLSPMKAAKLDAAAESKSEKKKSDFLTKLTAIREAQSERRKAREEKELFRETITQDMPLSAENEDVPKEKDISLVLTPSMSREDSKEVEEIMQREVLESEALIPEAKLEPDVIEAKDVSHPKEIVEDNIPVDFDTNWSESQGEWIEEYSDEHWEEGDEQWDGLGKKFQKMQKEFEEEAMQMAALWEKEELEDDVFEEETKVQQEDETVTDSDKKFDDWVKANLKVDSSEYEEEIELKGKLQEENLTAISLKERLELEGSDPSPLQHYPTALDLSLKSQFESEWVDLPADAEIEKLAHDIVCEGSDIENKFDETEMMYEEEERHLRKASDLGSDEDWEKIEIDEQLQEVNELDNYAFPDKEGEIEREAEEEIQDVSDKEIQLLSEVASEITIDKDATVLYKNLENLKAADASDVGVITAESSSTTDMMLVNDTKKPNDLPKVPMRRRSKLSSTDMDEALKNQSSTEISSNIPPPLPEKTRSRGDQQKVLDIYAVPDKTAKGSTLEDHTSKEFETELPSVPQKPPRLNLSPTMFEENALNKSEAEVSQKVLTKESSFTSVSYESDSNFFADSESDTEINLHRPKNIHRKLVKYENEFEEFEMKDVSVEKFAKSTVKEKKDLSENFEESISKEKDDILESNFDLELDEDIDPSLIEPLPRMKDVDYDPELPILLGGRGRQISDIDDVNAPKAFRGDTTRPLQLFKATKKESSFETVNMPEPTAVEIPASEMSFIQKISGELPSLAPVSAIPYETSTKISESILSETQVNERLYYNDSIAPQQSVADSHMPELKPLESLESLQIEKEAESIVQQTPIAQEDEITLSELEGLSAVADYFFGGYNEIKVTPPKKKTPTRPKPVTSSTNKALSKVMSSSEISPVSHPESISQMEQSAAAVLEDKSLQEDKEDKPTNLAALQKEQSVTESARAKETIPPPEKPKQPAPTECLSFAEDYLFGCYTQVVPPRKTKNVPVISAKIPKLGEIQSLSRPQSPAIEHKPSTPVSTPEPQELPLNNEEELVEEEVPEDEENDISIRTDTSTYDDIFHDLPPEVLSNQSFDESSIYYESFQDALEDAQGSSVIDGNVVAIRPKSVHFEEPEKPVIPPRRNKARLQKTKAPSSSDPNESYANEYLFRQYEPAPQAKKKLPLCSKDFRMNQGFEPTEIPSDTSLTPDEDEEEVICSETSVEISSKSNELLKSNYECDFGDSEQPLDLIKHDTKETELKDSQILVKSDDSILSERSVDVVSSSLTPDHVSTDIQSESFEELAIPDNLTEMIESSGVSEKLPTTEEDEALSNLLPCVVMESEIPSAQQVQSYDTMSNEASNRLEIDEFVFIEQAQNIIDNSYNLYDIEDSLVCDLNYVDVKGNIEDECTDDSEQEWKRNEDRKNTLNASFLTNAPSTKSASDQEEAMLDESQQYDQNEVVADEAQNEAETVLDETQKSDSDTEKVECPKHTVDDSKITQTDSEKESIVGQTLMDNLELVETAKENYEFSEQSEDVCSEKQIFTDEEYDELNIATETTEQYISTAADELLPSSESIFYDEEKEISDEVNEYLLESTQDIDEETSFINDEYLVMSESFENLTEKIDENILEIEKELSESYVPLEFDEILSEELTAVSTDYEVDDATNAASEITLEFCEEETEISEVEDMTMTEEVKLEFSKEAEISKTDDVSMPGEIDLESSQLEISEINEAIMDGTAKIECDEEKIKEAEFMDEYKILSEDQQIYVLEDFEASEELSDDNVSTHSSVSTQIAVSMKFAMKEIEGDECSLNLEQIDNFEEDSEPSSTQPAIAASQIREKTDEYISETDGLKFKTDEKISDIMLSKEEKQEYEVENESDTKVESPSEECRIELTPISLVSNELHTDISTEEAVFEKSISDENFELEENIADNIAKESKVAGPVSSEDSSHAENIPEIIETVDNENELCDLEKDEIEDLMVEESIMSHFYDEWYQSEATTKFSYLSAESIYAKYGSAESSESGNESDIDNALSSLDSKANTNETDVYKNEISLDSNISEQDVKHLEYDSEDLPLKKEIAHEVTEYDVISTSQESVISDISEVRTEVDTSLEFNVKSIEDNQEMYEKTAEESILSVKTDVLSLIQKETESAILQVADERSIQSIKEQETSETKTANKFSTSKSCQTEDSFDEEDVFFDSFDDTFTIPSYIHLPIEAQAKPPSTDISIQCELISIDDILSSKKILSISHTEVITAETQMILPKHVSPEESKLREEGSKESDLAAEEKEESSCESFEDSDSDIYIESPSSQDELDVSGKRSLLYAEVDSDTGFSSGSECGWTKKRDYKQKDLKKVSAASSESKNISLQASTLSSEEKEITVFIDSTVHDIQEKIVETSDDSEEKMAANIVEKDVEIFSDSTRSSPLPPEIIERAITPVAIPQFPSFEDDLVFVEVKESVEEITDNAEEEVISKISTTPTVEYFYGSLPETVKIESPPDSNEKFFETASELSESASLSADKTESFTDSSSSSDLAEKMPCELILDSKVASTMKGSEDESFAETISSLKGETEDSISEYYSFPDSVSLLSRASLAESDIFDLAQSEIFTDGGLPIDISSNYENKKEKSTVDIPLSETSKISDVIAVIESRDKQSDNISNVESTTYSKETDVSCDITHKIECISIDDQPQSEKDNEFSSICESEPPVETNKTVQEEELIDSKTELSSEKSEDFRSAEYEILSSDIIKPASDVPPVPSDIVRYLYYDDSITFDDESYHTQSESIGVPSLTSQDVVLVDSTDKVKFDEAEEKISAVEVSVSLPVESPCISEENPTIPTMESESEFKISDELVEKATEVVHDFQEAPTTIEISQEKIDLTAKEPSEDSTNLVEKTPESKADSFETIQSLTETDLKFPSIEVLPSESTAVLPATAEQTFEAVLYKEESARESVIVSDAPFEDTVPLLEDHEVQNVVEPTIFRQSSTEIPPVPSDIVRYLYYDDDITFDETTQSSFHSQYDNGLEGEQVSIEGAECLDLKLAVSDKPELLQDVADIPVKPATELPELAYEKSHLVAESYTEHKISDISFEDSSYKPDSGSGKDEPHVSFESSECFEDWFDLKETAGIVKHHDSEQYSSTRSSVLKEDSEPPCIPEYILSPKLSADIPIGKNDVDEITDISTHFTMTDDSDRFSDIDNDISLNFEEEFSDQIQMDQFEDVEDEFQFFAPEQVKEFSEQVKIMESISAEEGATELSKDQLKEHIISVGLDQQSHEEINLEFSEQKETIDKDISSINSSQLFKEHPTDSSSLNVLPEQLDKKETDQRDVSCEFKEKSEEMVEKFDECITSTSEVSKEDFAECLASTEFDQKSNKITEKKTTEISDEYVASTKISEISEEQFQGSLISNKMSEEKMVKDTDKPMSETIPKFPEQLSECIVSDENGNFPELLIKKDAMLDVTKMKDHISSEILEISLTSKESESSSADKNREVSETLISSEQSVYSEPSQIISEVKIILHEELELNLMQTETAESISSSKHDLETSCHTSPTEESHSISTEVSDNWSDADARFIEEDESVYDIPLEDVNITDFHITATSEESNERLTAIGTDSVNLKSFSSELEATISKGMDALTLQSLETEVKETNVKMTEIINASDLKPEISEIAEDLEVKLIESTENKQFETSHDDSNKIDEFTELDNISMSDKKTTVDSIKSDTFTPDSFCEQDSSQTQVFYDSLLSSDMKNIHEIKLETESEFSSTIKEATHFECMSTTPGAEPSFSPTETMHISEGVQSEKISSEEMPLVEEVITSTLTQAYAEETSSEDKISCGIAEEEAQIISKDDILERSDFKIMETKSIEILDSEISDYVSLSDSSKSYELSLNNVQPELKDKEIVFECLSEDKSAKYLNNVESIPQTTPVETVPLDQESKELVCFTMVPENIDFSECKKKLEEVIEAGEKSFISETLLGADDEKCVLETSVLSLKTADQAQETVDFKGCITYDKDQVSFKMKESTVIANENIDSKIIQSEKLAFSSDTAIPSEVIDFKGELKMDDLFSKAETVSKSYDKVPITIDKKESKTEISSESFEVVDFKLITSQDVTSKEELNVDSKGKKLVDESFVTSKKLDSTVEEKRGSFETVDFKGQIINLCESEKTDIIAPFAETKSTIIENREIVKEEEALKSAEFVKASVTQESVPIQREADFYKAEALQTHEVVDFKGQLTVSHETLASEIKDDAISISDTKVIDEIETVPEYKVYKLKQTDKLDDSKQSEFHTFETVDFKGNLTAEELKILSEEFKSRKIVPTIEDSLKKLESDIVAIEPLKEVVDFKGAIDSVSNIETLEENQEAISYDSQKTSYYPEEQDTAIYDPQEVYSFNNSEQAEMFDLRETYGYGFSLDEQAVISEPQQAFSYGVIEESEAFMSQQLTQYDEMLMPETQAFSYGVIEESEAFMSQQLTQYDEMLMPETYIISTEESSELYSCDETLSAVSDQSLQFHSFSHDLEDTSNVSTSEDFTDVPSHLTSTEDSDKWSDVEGDYLFEDVQYDRDKTPTRTACEVEKVEFISDSNDIQFSENLTETVPLKEENKIFSDNEKFTSSASEVVTTDLRTKFEKEEADQSVIRSSENVKEVEESSILGEVKKVEAICSLTESDNQLKLLTEKEISHADDSSMLQPIDKAELLSAETDLSIITASEDVTDVTSYVSAEGFENLSDMENEIEIQAEDPKICTVEQSEKLIVKTGIIDQVAQDDILTPLMEHFADIKSLKDPSTTAVPFSSVDIETAVPKMHEDVSGDVPSKSEKTEPELWLEAETEHSISELSEDIAVCIEEDGETKFVFVDYEKPVEYNATINDPSGTPHTSTTSTSSSSYSDFENSDHTSDTYADISLQGATTEGSDKWSDFETEDLNDNVLDVGIPETVEITDFSQLMKKPNESKFSTETVSSEDHLKTTEGSVTTTDLSSVEVKSDSKEFEIMTERKSISLSDASDKSIDLSSDNVSDLQQTFSSEEPSALSSSQTTKLSVGLSDEEFTDVTPLEITAEASDKLSDISDDTSLGEMEDESSVSLKAGLQTGDKELAAISGECKTDSGNNIQENEGKNLQLEISKGDYHVKTSLEQTSIQSNIQLQDTSDILSSEMSAQINKKEQDIPAVEICEKLDKKLASFEEPDIDKKEEPSLLCEEQDNTKMKDTEALSQSTGFFNAKSSETIAQNVETTVSEAVKEISSGKDVKALKTDFKLEVKKIDFEDSSISKITDDSETLDSFTDVLTHTITSETSDVYQDLDSDHSFEEVESLQIETESPGLQDAQTPDTPTFDEGASREIITPPVTECYENSLVHQDILEEADDFALDAIPENELENYEEEEYSLSEHFEINEDELIYPLPYSDDWIEQSFELKEYGVEAEFYESETDIHGLGIVHEDYDDDDIQRAIDYNLSTLEENEGDDENVIATDSFKTLSHDSSPHMKADEYDTWSTADAPSIEEEFEEQDNVLSKIDEILAEDFGDIYQPESYLKQDEDIADSLMKDISPSDDKFLDFIQSDKINVTSSDSATTQEVTKINASNDDAEKQRYVQTQEINAELEKISLKEDSSKAYESKCETISDKMKVGTKSPFKLDSEATSSAQKDTAGEFKSIVSKEETSSKIYLKSEQEIDSKSVSDKTIQKDISEKSKTDSVGSDVSIDKKAIQAFKTESTSLSSEITAKNDYTVTSEVLSSELTLKGSKLEPKSDYESLSKEVIVKKDSKTESDVSFHEITTETDRKSMAKSDSMSDEISKKKDHVETLKTKSEAVSSESSIKMESKLELQPESIAVSSEASIKKESKLEPKLESLAVSSEICIKKESKQEPKPQSIAVSSETNIKKESKLEPKLESLAVSSETYIKKESKQEPKPDSITVSSEISIKKESKLEPQSESIAVSSETSIKKEPKPESIALSSETSIKNESKLKPKSEIVSDEISLKKASDKSIKKESDEITLKKTSEKISKEESDAVSYKVTLDKDSTEETKTQCTLESSEIHIKKDLVEMPQTESKAVSSELSVKKASKSETASDESILKISSITDSKSELDAASKKVILEQDSLKEVKSESASLSKEIAIKKDYEESPKTESKVVSDEISIQEDSKLVLKPKSGPVSEESFKGNLIKESVTDSDVVSSEMTLKKKSEKENKLLSDSVSAEITIKKDSKQISKSKQDSAEDRTLLISNYNKVSQEENISTLKEASSKQIVKLAESTEISTDSKDMSLSTDVSAHVISSSTDTHKDSKDQFSDATSLSPSKTDSSADIPLTKFEETLNELSVSCKSSKESEVIESSQSSLLSKTSKHSIKSASESTEGQLNIPEQRVSKDETSSTVSITEASKEQLPSDSVVVEVKPDIPKKTKQKSIDLTETTPIKEETDKKPSLPPKKTKRHSLTDTPSASLSESLSSSSSAESIGSFESAVSDKSKKISLKSSDETSMHSLSPDVPTRRSRASKTSSSRSASRDSDDNSSCSRSSSLKIRRRSSNFAEPEPFDFSKKRASIDERMKKLQVEGKCVSKEKAFIAAKLIEMQFEEEDALLASRQCNSVYHAVKFLTQLCDMCNCRFPINLMSSLVNCTHRACKECLKAHFTSLLYDRSVFTLLCPICHKPDITDQNIQEYFTHLDMTLRNILEDKVYDLFQRKLRDEVLTKDPNFHWCSQCSSGFIASPRLKKLYCPDCSAITCAMCHQTWELEHEGVHCERFQQWKDMHTPEPPPAGLVKFLTDRGISCPSCGLLYAQACGGCMMYKCSHCSFEFCGFCIRPLKKGRECSNEICDARGHHIHHLHNCLFFLRDKDITEIQMLLEEESVTYFTIPPKNQIVKTRCQVREQKINHGIIIEDRCGRSIEPYCGGLCRTHYYEYLAELLRKNNISPLSIMTIQDLQFMLRKSRIFVPEKVKGETSEDYYERLLEFVTKSLT